MEDNELNNMNSATGGFMYSAETPPHRVIWGGVCRPA